MNDAQIENITHESFQSHEGLKKLVAERDRLIKIIAHARHEYASLSGAKVQYSGGPKRAAVTMDYTKEIKEIDSAIDCSGVWVKPLVK